MSALVQASAIRKFAFDPTPADIVLNSVVAGNSILVGLFAVEFSATVPDCTITDGTAYTLGRRTSYSASGTEKWIAEVHHLHNVGSGTHNIAVTSAAGATTPFGQIMAFEVSGLANAAPDKGVGTGASSDSPSTGSSGTLTQAGNFGLSVLGVNTGTNPAGIDAASESFVNAYLDNTVTEGPGSIDYKVITVTTALNVNWGTLAAAGHWVSALAVYADAASGGRNPMVGKLGFPLTGKL